MPVIPAPNDIHLDIPLTNFALKYASLEYLAYQIAPAVQVVNESDKYYIFNAAREQLNVPFTIPSPTASATTPMRR